MAGRPRSARVKPSRVQARARVRFGRQAKKCPSEAVARAGDNPELAGVPISACLAPGVRTDGDAVGHGSRLQVVEAGIRHPLDSRQKRK